MGEVPGCHWRRARLSLGQSQEEVPGVVEGGDEGVHLGTCVVAVQAHAGAAAHPQRAVQGLRTVVPRPDGDAVLRETHQQGKVGSGAKAVSIPVAFHTATVPQLQTKGSTARVASSLIVHRFFLHFVPAATPRYPADVNQ